MSYLQSWSEEKRSAFLYRALADKEKGNPRGELFSKLAQEAESQGAIWERKMEKPPGAYAPDLRARLVAFLIPVLGPRTLRTVLASLKIRGMSVYDSGVSGHAMPAKVEEVGRRHRGTKAGGNLRASVFGVNDGLVSNASLILGVAGATSDPHLILLSGIAGLLAGAFSMAAGEFVSVRSQREMQEYQIGLEREELEEYPDQEAQELALIYQAKGVPEQEALDVARRLIADPEKALDTLAREELGLNPDGLGSPWGAAFFSFLSFSAGAAIPLAPFLATSGGKGLLYAILLTAVALFAVGASLTLFTGRSALRGGLRMLMIGGGAGAVTYLIGRLLGVSLN